VSSKALLLQINNEMSQSLCTESRLASYFSFWDAESRIVSNGASNRMDNRFITCMLTDTVGLLAVGAASIGIGVGKTALAVGGLCIRGSIIS
jgi:hypothetical protein